MIRQDFALIREKIDGLEEIFLSREKNEEANEIISKFLNFIYVSTYSIYILIPHLFIL